MTGMIKLLVGGAGLAALAAAAPSAAQYYPSYGYSPYSYNQYQNQYQSYGYTPYATPYAMNTTAAASQCTTAVQNRLYTRQGLAGVIGSLLGAYATTPRVVAITRVSPTPYGTVRVRGLASSGRGYAYNSADLSFRCDVDASGYVRDVDINRRY
jgi:hypothetical protein